MKFPDDFIDQVILGDSLEVLKQIPDNSVDTIITDPPYGIAFMGKEWDSFGTDLQKYQEWTRQWASEVLRVAKPGATMLAFGGTRTFHRMTCGLEDAGWEIRDTLMWIYGQGFPKSLNIGKEVDKLQGNEREVVGKIDTKRFDYISRIRVEQGYRPNIAHVSGIRTMGFTEWEGYGTTLKPAYEPIILAMKPLDGTFAENALKWGVAGLNIDEARIPFEDTPNPATNPKYRLENGYKLPTRGQPSKGAVSFTSSQNETNLQGRFPANILLDEVSAEMLDEQSGISKSTGGRIGNKGSMLNMCGNNYQKGDPGFGDIGGASRFFYVAKASKSEREVGVDKNNHPTVKPIKLIDYLVKLTKMPNPNQVYLDPFLGSGTTAIAVVLNGRHFIGIEREPEYVEIAKKRIKYWGKKGTNDLFGDFGD
jgi:site-specific DNA-methyltransferase (adenine-specific)